MPRPRSEHSQFPSAPVAGDGPVLIDQLLTRCTFPQPGTSVVCAVSGGPDSLALLALACRAQLVVTAVHVDHGLRLGSADEAEVVASAAERFGASFRAETIHLEPGGDLEQRARIARRAVLGSEAMTGHTADDQAETMLINLLRGAGPSGLAAMEPGHRHPILAIRRSETVALTTELDLAPVNDPSNLDPRFVRNRVRHELLPLMAAISERDPVPMLARTAGHLRRVEADLQAMADDLDPTDCQSLRAAPRSVAAHALRRWLVDDLGHPPSTAELGRVFEVVENRVVACELSGGRRIARTEGQLRIE